MNCTIHLYLALQCGCVPVDQYAGHRRVPAEYYWDLLHQDRWKVSPIMLSQRYKDDICACSQGGSWGETEQSKAAELYKKEPICKATILIMKW